MNRTVLLLVLSLVLAFSHGASNLYKHCAVGTNSYYSANGTACQSGYQETYGSNVFRLNDASGPCALAIKSYIHKTTGKRRIGVSSPTPTIQWSLESTIGCGYVVNIGYSHGLPIIYEYYSALMDTYYYVAHTDPVMEQIVTLVFGAVEKGPIAAALPNFYYAERTSCYKSSSTERKYTYSSTCPTGFASEGVAFKTISNNDQNNGNIYNLHSYYSQTKSDRILVNPNIGSIPSGYVSEGIWGHTYVNNEPGTVKLRCFYKDVNGNYDRVYTTNTQMTGYTEDFTNPLGFVPLATTKYCGNIPCPTFKSVTRCYSSAKTNHYWIAGAGTCQAGFTSEGEVAKILSHKECPGQDIRECKTKCVFGKPLFQQYLPGSSILHKLSLSSVITGYYYNYTLGCVFPDFSSAPTPMVAPLWKQGKKGITDYISEFEPLFTNNLLKLGWTLSTDPAYRNFEKTKTDYCLFAYESCQGVSATNPFYPTTAGV